ncbi:MAG: hypothetical protein WAV28_15780 [Sedimentisphaerales bacterium]
MSIFTKRVEVQELRKQTAMLTDQVKKYKEVQELLVKDILTLREVTTAYKGNEYPEYASAVKAIADKYNNKADWGCTQTGTIVDLRAAFILGEGVRVVHTTQTRAEAKRELQWVTDFLDYNDLDGEMAQEIAKEAEIEGKCAIRLFYDDEPWKDWPGMVSARFLSWLSKKYTVTTDPNDYFWYKLIEWQATGTASAGKIEEPEFIYKKFGGRISEPNEAQPKIMKCLTIVDRLDKALRDLREINHLFASPTADFECDDAQQTEKLSAFIKDTNWKIGKAIIHTGRFSLKGPDLSGVENLIAEIELCVKMISGTTGIPIHFLGLLDLLKNRATGDNTRELVMAATTRERHTWLGVFNELMDKAMMLFNSKVNAQKSKEKQLDPMKIKVEIPLITQEHFDRLEKVYIPAALGGIISKEFVASQIPGVDMEAEAEKRQEREISEDAAAKRELALIKAQAMQEPRAEEDEE